jgi:hypothetical protein
MMVLMMVLMMMMLNVPPPGPRLTPPCLRLVSRAGAA